MLGKQMFATPCRHKRRREGARPKPYCSPPAHRTEPIFMGISSDNPLPGSGPLSKLFQAVKGKVKENLLLSLLGLVFSSKLSMCQGRPLDVSLS